MLVSKLKDEDLTTEVIERLLFNDIKDTGEVADCILVLGSKKSAQYRVPIKQDVLQKSCYVVAKFEIFLPENPQKPRICIKPH